MKELLLFSFAASLSCLLIHVAITWDGMIFNWAEKYLNRLNDYFQKPLYACMTCMCSVWTPIAWYGYYHSFSLNLLFAVLIVGGMNTILCVFLEKCSDYGC